MSKKMNEMSADDLIRRLPIQGQKDTIRGENMEALAEIRRRLDDWAIRKAAERMGGTK